jgi:hypothetical protein
MGAANSDAKLYDDEIQSLVAAYPDQFRVDYALSREQKNKKVRLPFFKLAACADGLPARDSIYSNTGSPPSSGLTRWYTCDVYHHVIFYLMTILGCIGRKK